MSFDIQKVKERIDPSDVFELLVYLGGEPEEKCGTIVSKTISHGGDSKKLFYYPNTQLFIDYTDGGSRFDVFELVSRVLNMPLTESILFVVNFLGLDDSGLLSSYQDDWSVIDRYEAIGDVNSLSQVSLPVKPQEMLINYPKVIVRSWVKDHITPAVQNEFDIRFNPLDSSILIPHKDEYGSLIGVRKRALVEEDIERGKYRPAVIGGELMNHPLAFNLYGLDKAKESIRESGMAIVVEAEKSVLQSHSYGVQQTVACCGSSISLYQVNMLLRCGAKEMVIGFDSDYKDIQDKEAQKVVNRLMKLYEKISPYLKVSFLWDKQHLLGYKDSPFDKGKDVFMKLWKTRVVL